VDLSTVIQELKTNPDQSFVSCLFDEKTKYLKLYIATFDAEEEWFSVFFEGGKLFSDYGEEDVYSLEDLPEEVKRLNFKRFDDYSSLMGVMSEYAAHLLFPSLPSPEKIYSKLDQDSFAVVLTALVSALQTK
jgi:hypothetical protein